MMIKTEQNKNDFMKIVFLFIQIAENSKNIPMKNFYAV